MHGALQKIVLNDGLGWGSEVGLKVTFGFGGFPTEYSLHHRFYNVQAVFLDMCADFGSFRGLSELPVRLTKTTQTVTNF